MKLYLFIFLILILVACSPSTPKEEQAQIPQENPVVHETFEEKKDTVVKQFTKPSFTKINEQAVLIGSTLSLLDENLNVVQDISHLNGELVRLVSVSESLYNEKPNICKAFYYVKIKNDSLEGLMNGRDTYRIVDSYQDTSFQLNGHKLELYVTNYLGMGVFNEDGLLGCPEYTPILIKDTFNHYFGLVELKQHYSNEDTSFKYLQLFNDEQYYDQITKISTIEDTTYLHIERNMMEGAEYTRVALYYDNNSYKALYLHED